MRRKLRTFCNAVAMRKEILAFTLIEYVHTSMCKQDTRCRMEPTVYWGNRTLILSARSMLIYVNITRKV